MADHRKSSIARLIAATALVSLAMQPLAFADRGRGHDDRGRYSDDDDDSHRRRGRGHDDRRGRGHDRYDDRYDNRYERRSDYRDGRYYGYGDRTTRVIVNRYPDYRSSDYGYRSDRYRDYRYSDYRPRYSVGNSYRCHERTVYITDYDRYGLYDPPRGYHWVRDQDNGDAVLASVATGAIIGLIVGAIAYD